MGCACFRSESTSCNRLYLAIHEKETSWSLFKIELHRLRGEIWTVIAPRDRWFGEKVEFDVRSELEACVHSRGKNFSFFSLAWNYLSLSVEMSDLVTLVKRYLF